MQDTEPGRDTAGLAVDNAEPGLDTITHIVTRMTYCMYHLLHFQWGTQSRCGLTLVLTFRNMDGGMQNERLLS